MPPDNQLERLENIISLTRAQETQALIVFQQLNDTLGSLTPAQRMGIQGLRAHQDARAAIRALLTPAQVAVYNRTPQRLGGASGALDPAQQAFNTKIRTLVRESIRNSADVAAQVGPVQQLRLMQEGAMEVDDGSTGSPQGGSNAVEVTGDKGTKTFQVDWEVGDDGAIRIVRIQAK